MLYGSLAGFFGPFMARLCLMNSAKYIEARVTTLVTLAAPPLTLVIAYILLSDLPNAREIQGGIVMLVGISIPVISLMLQARQPRTTRAG
jgi:drug/metabolite transporter (DMT)-like permease